MDNIVIIPVYRNNPLEFEVFSLIACFDVFRNRKIIIVAPDNLSLVNYQKHVGRRLVVERFNQNYFSSISGYNQLMLSNEFYSRFDCYQFMLIYQLDCFVFKDELDKWANMGFDYIGAPWLLFDLEYYSISQKVSFWRKLFYSRVFGNMSKLNLNYRVGNGGFSLRRIYKFSMKTQAVNNKVMSLFKGNDSTSIYNEDVYWSLFANDIKIPDYKTGCLFSLESFPERGLRYNNGVLPFGCHAWPKEFEFWSKYIPYFGALSY